MTPPPSQIFAPEALAGRVVLVTGGGTNLGRQAAIELAAAGAQVVIAGRREEILQEAAAQIGERCSCVAGDIREPADAYSYAYLLGMYLGDGYVADTGRSFQLRITPGRPVPGHHQRMR